MFESEKKSREAKKVAAAKADTLAIRGRQTKTIYHFKRIKSREDMVAQLYAPPEMSKAEMYEFVKEIKEKTEQTDAEHEKLAKRGISMPKQACRVRLPIKCLQANPQIARENLIDWQHVADIAQEINLDALGYPTVHARRILDDHGKFLRWEFTLLDWTHRYVWAFDEGHTHLECVVRIVEDIAESACTMHYINRNVRRQNVIDAMRNRVVGENPKIVRLIKILDEYGFKPQTSNARSVLTHGTIGLTKLEKLYDQFGEDVVYRILDWLSTAKYVGWDAQATACSPDILHGLALLAAAERAGFVHTQLIDAVLTANSPESVINQSNNELSMRDAQDLYGAPVSSKSEEGRAKRIFCVFLKQAKERLGNGRLRLKSPHVSTFKSLMNNYHKSRARGPAARQKIARKVWSLRQQLYNVKAGDYWFNPDSSPPGISRITR
jgi:hypothetical protein